MEQIQPDAFGTDGTNLPGYRKPSFAMAFGGGEIWFEHLDGIYGHSELTLEKLRRDALTFHRPSATSLIAVNLDETVLTDALIGALADALTAPGKD